MLKGKGYIVVCPHCDGDLEYIDSDVDGKFYWEEKQCSECKAVFIVIFKAIEWKQVKKGDLG